MLHGENPFKGALVPSPAVDSEFFPVNLEKSLPQFGPRFVFVSILAFSNPMLHSTQYPKSVVKKVRIRAILVHQRIGL